jgi:hypothetical protein
MIVHGSHALKRHLAIASLGELSLNKVLDLIGSEWTDPFQSAITAKAYKSSCCPLHEHPDPSLYDAAYTLSCPLPLSYQPRSGP